MNSIVREVLIKNGWFNSRLINPTEIELLYTRNSYPILDCVIEFLKNFYTLKIVFSNKKTGNLDDINFDVKRAMDMESIERVIIDYEPRIKKKLCIIGSAYREHFILLMDEDGSVYGGFDTYFVKIAPSGYLAIEAIILDKEFEEIKSFSA